MDAQANSISVTDLVARLWRHDAPLLLDVRREADFADAGKIIPGALRQSAEPLSALPAAATNPLLVVVYCAHGRTLSQDLCRALQEAGRSAVYLEGGFAAWAAEELPTVQWTAPLSERPSRWITRERPKIDRIACPWLIRRFIDPRAEFFYVPTAEVKEQARRLQAVAYDIPDVPFSHVGEHCSFDAVLQHFALQAPGLDRLALIVRGADTARLDLAPQASGLLAVSLGLSLNFPDDQAMLLQGLTLYDALYAWCRYGRGEGHDWKPETMRVRA